MVLSLYENLQVLFSPCNRLVDEAEFLLIQLLDSQGLGTKLQLLAS